MNIKAIFAAIVAAVRTYPNGTAILLSVVVTVAAKAGLNITSAELIAIFGFATTLFGTLAHYSYRTHEAKAVETAKLGVVKAES